MDHFGPQPTRRFLTPAIVGAAVFAAACAAVAVVFVAARGGLELPVSAERSAVPTAVPSQVAVVPTSSSPPQPTPGPSEPGTPVPTPAPTSVPTPAATVPPWQSIAPDDALLALPGCPDRPGCFEYRIQRGDTLSGVASRYAIPVATVLALNPEIADPSTIVADQVLYLGRNPFVRLDRCPDGGPCWLYVVSPGDRLSTIAARYGLTVAAILEANPEIGDPNRIFSGQVIRLPEPIPA